MNIASRIEGTNKTLGTIFLDFRRRCSSGSAGARGGAQNPGRPEGQGRRVPARGRWPALRPDSALLVQSTIGVLLQHQQRFTGISTDVCSRWLLRPKGSSVATWTARARFSHMMQFLVHADEPLIRWRSACATSDGDTMPTASRPSFYPAFRQAFLESGAGFSMKRYTPEVEKAWTDTHRHDHQVDARPVVRPEVPTADVLSSRGSTNLHLHRSLQPRQPDRTAPKKV